MRGKLAKKRNDDKKINQLNPIFFWGIVVFLVLVISLTLAINQSQETTSEISEPTREELDAVKNKEIVFGFVRKVNGNNLTIDDQGQTYILKLTGNTEYKNAEKEEAAKKEDIKEQKQIQVLYNMDTKEILTVWVLK